MVQEIRLVLLLPGQTIYRQGMISFDGLEEWDFDQGLLSLSKRIHKLLQWCESNPIPLSDEAGTQKILTSLLADKLNGQTPSAVLSADKSTGEQPMALFDIEDQAENYLAMQTDCRIGSPAAQLKRPSRDGQ
jgi:hypothetical protein